MLLLSQLRRVSTSSDIAPSSQVLFAAIAGPIARVPQVHDPLVPSRLRNVVATRVGDNKWPHNDVSPSKETTDDLESNTSLSRPGEVPGSSSTVIDYFNTKHGSSTDLDGSALLSQVPSILAPDVILAYGPYLPSSNSNHPPVHPFEYRVYLHHVNGILSSPFKFAYGNLPFTPIDYLDLDDSIDEEFITNLDEDRLRFLILTSHLICYRTHTNFPTDFPINSKHLTFGWIPSTARTPTTIAYRYPIVEILLSLVTYLVYHPEGTVAHSFRRNHPFASKAIFISPTPSIDSDDSDSSDFPIYSTPSDSHEWEIAPSSRESAEVERPRVPTPFDVDSTRPSQTFPTLSTIYEQDSELPSVPQADISDRAVPASLLLNPPSPEHRIDRPLTDTTKQDTVTDDLDDTSPSYSPIDHCMNEADIDKASNADEESKHNSWRWSPDYDAWGPPKDLPPQREFAFRSREDIENVSYQVRKTTTRIVGGTDRYKGPSAVDPGIFAYGPFKPCDERNPPLPVHRDYRVYIHPISHCDVLDLFAYGGPGFKNGKIANLYKMPVSPFVADSRLSYIREFGTFIHHVESYIAGDKCFTNGVPIPDELLGDPTLMPNQHDGTLHYRFPQVERFLSTIAARCGHPRLTHPFGRLELTHLHYLVSPKFPTRDNETYDNIVPPDLPYIRAVFHSEDERHPEDTKPILLYPYYGCLPRKSAYLFQKHYPVYGVHLYHTAVATYFLFKLHACPKTQPTVDPDTRIDWDDLLDPQFFREVFPFDTQSRVLSRLSPDPDFPNPWIPRLPHILQCSRQVTFLIQSFEAFFKTLGYDGLRGIVKQVDLNTEINFSCNVLLSTDEAEYLTALYDFLLREHAINLAQPILRLLHIPFENPHQLARCRDIVINSIERPSYSYVVNEGYYM